MAIIIAYFVTTNLCFFEKKNGIGTIFSVLLGVEFPHPFKYYIRFQCLQHCMGIRREKVSSQDNKSDYYDNIPRAFATGIMNLKL